MEHLNKERIQKFKKTGDLQYIYQNEIDKTWFKRDIAYEDFKDLTWKTASDKILRDNLFHIAKNPKYLFQLSMNFLINKLLVEQLKMKIALTKS